MTLKTFIAIILATQPDNIANKEFDANVLLEAASLIGSQAGSGIAVVNNETVVVAHSKVVLESDSFEEPLLEYQTRLAAATKAKGELIQFLCELDTKGWRKIRSDKQADGDRESQRISTKESYSATATQVLQNIKTLSVAYSKRSREAHAVVISKYQGGNDSSSFQSDVLVTNSLGSAIDELQKRVSFGSIPMTGTSIAVIQNDTIEKYWAIAWSTQPFEGSMRTSGIKGRLEAGRTLMSFVNGEQIRYREGFISEMIEKQQRQIEGLQGDFSNQLVDLTEELRASSLVHAKSAGVQKQLRNPVRVGEWVICFTGIEFDRVKSQVEKISSGWGGTSQSKEQARMDAKEWALSTQSASRVPTGHSFGASGAEPIGVGAAVCLEGNSKEQEKNIIESLRLIAKESALRGLSLSLGYTESSQVEAEFKRSPPAKIMLQNGRIFALIEIETNDLKWLVTSGTKVDF